MCRGDAPLITWQKARSLLRASKGFAGLTAEELNVVEAAKEALDSFDLISCTACDYCAKVCPRDVGISASFLALNADIMFGRHVQEWLNASAGRQKPSACIECHACFTDERERSE